jgi:diguanylate cyclase
MRKSPIHTPPAKTPATKTAVNKPTPAAVKPTTAASSQTGTTPAAIAKGALRRMAEQRLEPTPENYRKAYEAESGVPSPATTPSESEVAVSQDAALTSATSNAPQTTSEPAPPVSSASAPDDGERWSNLITRIVKGSERGGFKPG